ncbi:hypothetical protein [Beijerinckia sp. L45]|uniref:hypothetical protein n=1 Tax=Beijerinckia sp. L45 TaxID=1641855 RepID=UPI00131D6A75|nr:hypothetical protein [Beijerinckia sp. L45]
MKGITAAPIPATRTRNLWVAAIALMLSLALVAAAATPSKECMEVPGDFNSDFSSDFETSRTLCDRASVLRLLLRRIERAMASLL